VFGLTIPMYGVMTACGMLAAFLLLFFTHRSMRFNEDQILSAALWAIIMGFLGAKILYWIVEIDQILADPHYLIHTLREGFVFYGALIGGLGGIAIYAAKHKLPFLAFVDLFAPSLVLAHAFGRIGCHFAGCCYGMECECAISVVFPEGAVAPAGVPRLPTQLMESAFLFILAVVLVMILRKKKPFGTILSWYMILYGLWRFGIEFFRADERGMVGALSTSQFISIFTVVAGVVLLILVTKQIIRSPEIPEPVKDEKKGKATVETKPAEEEKRDAKETEGKE
jgi:phosphatidylglycerol:prolipoprotein diacylglycerol transferase